MIIEIALAIVLAVIILMNLDVVMGLMVVLAALGLVGAGLVLFGWAAFSHLGEVISLSVVFGVFALPWLAWSLGSKRIAERLRYPEELIGQLIIYFILLVGAGTGILLVAKYTASVWAIQHSNFLDSDVWLFVLLALFGVFTAFFAYFLIQISRLLSEVKRHRASRSAPMTQQPGSAGL